MKRRFIIFQLISIAFLILNASIKAEEEKVIARVKYSFPHALPGEVIELKRLVTKDGEMIIVSSSEEYKTLRDIEELKQREYELIREEYGCISHDMINKFDSMSDSECVKVILQFNNSVTDEQLELLNLSVNREIINDITVIDSINKSRINSLKFNSMINLIEEYKEPIPLSGGDENCEECPHGDDGIPDPKKVYTGDAYSRSFFNLPEGVDSMPEWARGDNVNIATFENGIDSAQMEAIFEMHPMIDTGHIAINFGIEELGWTHSQMCFHAMIHTAPEAKFYHFRGGVNDNNLISYIIEAASRSYLDGGYNPQRDALTYNEKSAIICIPTGNYGVAFPVNKSNVFGDGSLYYNAIYVGGCTHTNNSYYEILNDEYFQYWECDNKWKLGTPQTQTQSRNNSGLDKEVPHIVVPTRVTCLGSSNKDEVLHSFSGTSAGAPSMNGICACVISANPDVMSHNTENVRTALMVTAENIDGGYWNPLVDGRDGCGVVSGYSSAIFARNIGDTSKLETSPPDTIGLAYGIIPNDDLLSHTRKRFNVLVHDVFPENKHFRAVLTWSSSTDKSNAYIRTLSDLNLELLDKETGEIIGRCASFTDNHEVIDIPNFKLEENREYSLEILIDDIIFPQDGATRDYIKYSLGWTWVNDFGGKSFIDTTFTGDNEFNLLNRNIVFNKNTNFADNSTTFITAGERIELNPGVVIEEGAEFTTGIANQEVKYDAPALNEYGHISSSSDARLADYSGNNRNGWLEGADSVDLILNRYCQIPYSSGSPEASGAIFLNGDASYWLSSPGYPDGNPKYAGGLTLSMCIKFYKDTVSTGYIFTSYSELRGEGYYLRVDDIDKYNKQLIFHISGRGEQSEINADIDQEDLEGWVKAQPEPYNWGWVHVSAVWKAGDYVSLYVNGINKTSYVSTDVEFCPTDNLCYIGKDPKLMPEAKSFKGGVDEVRLYSGPISGDDIYAEYHRGGFPVQWQQDRYKLTLWVGAGGIADLDLIYTDIEDISPPDTVEGESEKVFIVSRGFDVKMRFIADEGYKVDNVKKINLSNDVVIDLGEIQSHKMTQYGFKREKYRFEVTFIEDTQ